jgi:hypothetical protein
VLHAGTLSFTKIEKDFVNTFDPSEADTENEYVVFEVVSGVVPVNNPVEVFKDSHSGRFEEEYVGSGDQASGVPL